MKRAFKIFSSLRLTVICLIFAVLLVFFGTLAQVNEGLYQAQARWFRSFFVWWGPESAGWKIPFFPGGYLVGGVLLTNLITAHVARFKVSWKKLGINVTHAGIILLLVGQLATDLLSHETQMRFSEGESKNFSESALSNELVITTDSGKLNEEEVVSIPESILRTEKEIRHEKLPFVVRVTQYYPNAQVRARGPMVDKGEPPATRGIGAQAVVTPLAETHTMDARNFPAAVIDLVGPQGSLGTWLVSTMLNRPQEIKLGDRTWRVSYRWERQYLPFNMQLLKATHEVYTGTEIPKNFQSRIRIENPQRSENREVDIYMNNPLRYEGLTFFQYQMGRDEMDISRGSSTLQVVKNPSWRTPYIGCLMVGAGMLIQFLMHLVGFISKRRIAA
jgi:hypothetical protein